MTARAPGSVPPPSSDWPAPPSEVRLDAGEVQVWRASLAAPAALRARLRATLADDERARADRFVAHVHRDRFVVARAFLRAVLGRLLAIPPDAVRFRYEAAGKPRTDMLRFNLSPSGALALLAVTRDREVGVDVEELRAVTDAEALAERFFAPGETERLRSLDPAARDAAFLRCWTLKEAYVKAVGEGLGLPLDRFEVGYVPVVPSPALRLLDESPDDGRWALRTLEPGPGYVGALAAEGQGFRLTSYQWSP